MQSISDNMTMLGASKSFPVQNMTNTNLLHGDRGDVLDDLDLGGVGAPRRVVQVRQRVQLREELPHVRPVVGGRFNFIFFIVHASQKLWSLRSSLISYQL